MRNDVQATVAVRSEGKTSLNVLSSKVGEISEHFGNCHAPTQVIENVGYRDAGPADARFSAADARIDRDALSVIHATKVVFWTRESRRAQKSPAQHF